MRGERGFTLFELLTVLATVAVVAAAAYVNVNPENRARDVRDGRRYADADALRRAVAAYEADTRAPYGGEPAAPIDDDPATAQVIVADAAGIDCASPSAAPTCPDAAGLRLDVSDPHACVASLDNAAADTDGLVDTYLASLPHDPLGEPAAGVTGYYLNRDADGTLTVGACHGEHNHRIMVTR